MTLYRFHEKNVLTTRPTWVTSKRGSIGSLQAILVIIDPLLRVTGKKSPSFSKVLRNEGYLAANKPKSDIPG